MKRHQQQRQPETAEQILERQREARRLSVQRARRRAALVISGVTLDDEHVKALRAVQRSLPPRARSQAAAIRAALMLVAELLAAKGAKK